MRFLCNRYPTVNSPILRLAELARTHSSDGVFGIQDPAIEWLRAHVRHGISQYLVMNELPSQVEWGVRARFEMLAPGDYRPLASRPGSYLGGLYVIRSPSQASGSLARNDLSPGLITFYDPRVGMNMNAIRDDPYIAGEQTLNLEPGLLLIWPGFVQHFIHPNMSTEPAIRIIFDVQLRG